MIAPPVSKLFCLSCGHAIAPEITRALNAITVWIIWPTFENHGALISHLPPSETLMTPCITRDCTVSHAAAIGVDRQPYGATSTANYFPGRTRAMALQVEVSPNGA